MARVGASIGVALATAGNTDAATLIHEADAAAYAAKSSGRGRAHVYDTSMRRAADRRRVLEQDLRDAIGRDELVLHFQPIVGTQSGDVEGYEALVRWERPGTGLLPPDEFLPIAEESGLIDAVDAWVLDRAAGQLARWRRLFGAETPYISVNLSPRHVSRPHVVDSVAAALEHREADPALLVVETGEAVLSDLSGSVAHLRRIRELGVRVSVDDFGAGFSSLSRFADLPVDIVKIDRRYVDVGTTPSGRLLHLMVQGAHAVGLTAVAQGVEHDVQLATLRALDCESVQGFHIARPMPAEEAEAYHRDRAADRFGGLLSQQSGA
jgi:EAL domain-containing protein (putative c-di-GMP-specific phosphodiesterase class I)